MATNANANATEEVTLCLQELHLPTMRAQHETVARQATAEAWGYAEYLLELARREVTARCQSRIQRVLKSSKLPLEKSWSALDLKRLPTKVVQQLRGLLSGEGRCRRGIRTARSSLRRSADESKALRPKPSGAGPDTRVEAVSTTGRPVPRRSASARA